MRCDYKIKPVSILQVSILEYKYLHECCPQQRVHQGGYPLWLTMLYRLRHFWNVSLYQSDLYAQDTHRKWNQPFLIHSSLIVTHPEQVNEWLFSKQTHISEASHNTSTPYRVAIQLSDQVPFSFQNFFQICSENHLLATSPGATF